MLSPCVLRFQIQKACGNSLQQFLQRSGFTPAQPGDEAQQPGGFFQENIENPKGQRLCLLRRQKKRAYMFRDCFVSSTLLTFKI